MTAAFGNVVASEDVQFDVTSGSGTLDDGGSPVTSLTVATDASGVAEAVFTTDSDASSTNQVTATVVSSPLDVVTFTIPVTPGTISYYTVVPSTTTPVAGAVVDVTVTAYDQNDNVVTTDNTTNVLLSASSGNVNILTANPATLSSGVVSFQVSDNVSESFTLTAQTQGDASKTGTSGEIGRASCRERV